MRLLPRDALPKLARIQALSEMVELSFRSLAATYYCRAQWQPLRTTRGNDLLAANLQTNGALMEALNKVDYTFLAKNASRLYI